MNMVALAAECHKWGLPLMVEAIPYGWPKADKRTPDKASFFLVNFGGSY